MKSEEKPYSWVSWKKIALPKESRGGGIGIEASFMFGQSFNNKGCLESLKGELLWVKVVHHKYIYLLTTKEWFITRGKSLKIFPSCGSL